MDPLYQTIEEFAAEGYTHIECFCPRCHKIRPQPRWVGFQDIDGAHARSALSAAIRCAEWGGPLQSVKPWRQADVLGKSQGWRG